MEADPKLPVPLPVTSPFEERKIELQRSKRNWRNWFILNVILLLGVAGAVFWEMVAETSFSALLWLELALGLPLAYSAIFFHAQHNREREFLEEYSFKSVVARSLSTYRTLLKEDIKPELAEDRKKFLDFMTDSIESLHEPPRAIISKHPLKDEEDVKIGLVEKLGDVFKKFIP
jgi:hypothetical protein